MAVDPNFNSVSLLCHFGGTNGSTTVTDSSNNALAVSCLGNAQISTTQSKFGGSSGAFDGTGDDMRIASNALLNLGTGDFTIEAWVYPTAYTNSFASVLASGQSTFVSGAVSLMLLSASQKISLVGPAWNAGGNDMVISTSTIPLNTWTHIEVTRASGVFRLFVNGALEATTSNGSATVNFSSNGTRIGSNGWDAAASYFTGYVDELRVTKGIARHTAGFTPATEEFPNTGIAPASASQTIPALPQVATASTGSALSATASQTIPALPQTATIITGSTGVIRLSGTQTLPAPELFARISTGESSAPISAWQNTRLPGPVQTATVAVTGKATAAQAVEAFTQDAAARHAPLGAVSALTLTLARTQTATARVQASGTQTLTLGRSAAAVGVLRASQACLLPAFAQNAVIPGYALFVGNARTLKITAQDRALAVPFQNRSLAVPAQARTYSVR